MASSPSPAEPGPSIEGRVTLTESPWATRVISVSGICTSTRSPLSSLSISKAVCPLATSMAGSISRTEIEPVKGASRTERRRSRFARASCARAASTRLAVESRAARSRSSSCRLATSASKSSVVRPNSACARC
jgi:hypothetical protein